MTNERGGFRRFHEVNATKLMTVGAESRAPELATATVVVPHGVSQDKQLLLSHARGRGLSSSPRCTHLGISKAGHSPRRPEDRNGATRQDIRTAEM